MTYTLNIANHHGSHLTREETEWPAFNDRQEYCGQIYLIKAWAVPEKVHESLELPSHIDLYITPKGHWASTLEHAEHYISNTEAPTEFLVVTTHNTNRSGPQSSQFWDQIKCNYPVV
jgi:hypothetical protein